jgi:DNA-binding NarL/FixJ family response regulator
VPSYRILIVEDFADFRRFISSTLQQNARFQVIGQASDGLEALEKAKELQPDLILLDVGLPKLNGLEVAKRVRTLTPAKILFLSALSDPDLVQQTLSLGAGYVDKARAQSDLLSAVEAVLRGEQFVSPGVKISGGMDVQSPVSHAILFCSDEATLLDSLTRFVAAALDVGNPALVLATELHQESLLQRLHALRVNVDVAIRRGTYISLDADTEPDPVRFLQAVRGLSEAASKAGKEHPRVAVFGERAGRLWAAGKTDEAIRFEQFGNELVKSCATDILCGYPSPHGHENDPVLKSICAEHTAVYSR